MHQEILREKPNQDASKLHAISCLYLPPIDPLDVVGCLRQLRATVQFNLLRMFGGKQLKGKTTVKFRSK